MGDYDVRLELAAKRLFVDACFLAADSRASDSRTKYKVFARRTSFEVLRAFGTVTTRRHASRGFAPHTTLIFVKEAIGVIKQSLRGSGSVLYISPPPRDVGPSVDDAGAFSSLAVTASICSTITGVASAALSTTSEAVIARTVNS